MGIYHNEIAEKAVLAAMLKDGVAAKNINLLTPEDFFKGEHREIYAAMKNLANEGKAVCLPTMYGEISRLYGDGIHMEILVDATKNNSFGSEFALKSNAKMLRDLSLKRDMLRGLESAIDKLNSGEELPEVADYVRVVLRSGIDSSNEIVTLQQCLLLAFEDLERRARGEAKGMSTGIRSLDSIVGGMHRGELTIIGARPAVGKSALGMQIALSAARAGYHVGVVSREMTAEQYGVRVLSRGAKVNGMHTRTGDLSEEEWAELTESLMLYSKEDVRFLFKSRYIEDLYQEVQTMKETGLDMLVVDYTQLLQSRSKFQNEYQRIGHVSKLLKDMSVDFNIAVVALAQVGRSAENSAPTLSELRGSGDLEQDADNVIFIHRPTSADDVMVRDEDRGLFNIAEKNGARYIALIVAKQRQGETGFTNVLFWPEKMQYECIAR